MTSFVSRLAFAVPLAVGLLATPSAFALGTVEGEIAAKVGLSTAGSVGPGTPYGPGGGVRGGVAIHGAYVGLEVLYYQGTPSDLTALQGGLELGYGFKTADETLTLRPQVGVGVIAVTGGASNGVPDSRAEGGYYVAPGFTLMVQLTPNFFVGADVSVELMPGSHYDSPTSRSLLTVLAAHGQIGWRF
jgi:hypothetical protein